MTYCEKCKKLCANDNNSRECNYCKKKCNENDEKQYCDTCKEKCSNIDDTAIPTEECIACKEKCGGGEDDNEDKDEEKLHCKHCEKLCAENGRSKECYDCRKKCNELYCEKCQAECVGGQAQDNEYEHHDGVKVSGTNIHRN